MLSRPPLVKALTFGALLIAASPCRAEDNTPLTASTGELRYPSIHLKVAESALTPPLRSAKDELVMGSQILEDALHKSGAVYEDPALEQLLQEALPTDALGEKAEGFKYRIYILKDPTINAMTTPSGSIYINSGILAAMENTDQIRLVLAHEAHHIIDQDIVYMYKKLKDEIGAINFIRLVATPVVAVAIGNSDSDSGRLLANIYTGANLAVGISYQMSVLGYGRENENECDTFAMQIFNKNQYDLGSAKRTFQLFEDEHKKYGKGFQSHLFSDHETGKQRAARVEKFMKEVGYQPPAEKKEDARYHELTHEVRVENARLNLKVKRPWHAIEDLERLAVRFPNDARIPCLLGRAYALSSQDIQMVKDELSRESWNKLAIKDEKTQKEIWSAKAINYFTQSIALDPNGAEAYKELGLLKEAEEKFDEAAENFEKYLELAPQAKDVRYIRSRAEKARQKLVEIAEAKAKQEAKKKND